MSLSPWLLNDSYGGLLSFDLTRMVALAFLPCMMPGVQDESGDYEGRGGSLDYLYQHSDVLLIWRVKHNSRCSQAYVQRRSYA